MRYILLGLFILFATPVVQGATLYMDPNTGNLNRGDAIKIAVRLDTDEAASECVNAVDGVISYSDSVIPVDVSVGKSIFPVWVEAPVINKTDRTITFAGGIPNGYCGRVQGDPNLTNTIVEIIFRAPGLQVGGGEARNSADIQFTDQTAIYLNDGLGTKADVRTFGTALTLSDSVGSEIVDPWSGDVQADDVKPEEFTASIESIDGSWFVIFNTTDKQTGISHYEVLEETVQKSKLFDFGAANAPWVTARSPYLLKDQSRNSMVRIKAVDKAGNEYVTTLAVDESQKTFKLNYDYVVIGLAMFGGLILLLIVFVVIRRRRLARKAEIIKEEIEDVI